MLEWITTIQHMLVQKRRESPPTTVAAKFVRGNSRCFNYCWFFGVRGERVDGVGEVGNGREGGRGFGGRGGCKSNQLVCYDNSH